MLFGMTIEPYMLVAGGTALFALIGFQILVGLRKIKFKGPLHMRVHKWTAFAMLAFAVLHATVAMAYLGVFRG